MRQQVCAGLALAASYWRVPAAALGPDPARGDPPGEKAENAAPESAAPESAAAGSALPESAAPQERCEQPSVLRHRPPRPGRHRAP
jgi:hypothetical protein